MESYFNCCGMCMYLNLYDKFNGRFKCMKREFYCKATEERCAYFRGDSKRSYKDIDYARESRF